MTKQEDNTIKYMLGIQILLILILVFQVNGISNKLDGGVPGAGVVAPTPTAAPTPTPTPTTPTDMKKLADDDPVKGQANAPVTIVEWSDFECPFCARFYRDTLPSIQTEYIDTGKVKLVYRDFPLGFHSNAEPAAIAANCAGQQGKFWEYHDLLFDNAQSLNEASYTKWAGDLGLDVSKWNTCRQDPATKQEIAKDLSDGSAAGIRGTPGFIINGQLVSGAQPFSAFKQVIDSKLN